ncbi:hypothetical protein SUGI_0420200 [Cryptomeria japonica]|nr:hypothetical protein SUGI_0420200 [Cryptomeria japonica]
MHGAWPLSAPIAPHRLSLHQSADLADNQFALAEEQKHEGSMDYLRLNQYTAYYMFGFFYIEAENRTISAINSDRTELQGSFGLGEILQKQMSRSIII